MKAKIKRYLKEVLIFGVLLLLISSVVSLYRTSSMKIDDDVCQRGADIVYFWATWCPVCKLTSPNVERVSSSFDILGIAVGSEADLSVEEYMHKHRLHFKNIGDSDATMAAKYGIHVFPTFVFCKEGHVKMLETGYMSSIGLWLRAWVISLY